VATGAKRYDWLVLAGRVWRVVSVARGEARVVPVAAEADALRFLRRGNRGAFWRFPPEEMRRPTSSAT